MPAFSSDVCGWANELHQKKQLCLNCFARCHQQRECTSTHSCFTCRARHHTLLHNGNHNSQSTSAISSSAGPQNPAVQGAATGSENLPLVQNCLATSARAVLLGTRCVDLFTCHSPGGGLDKLVTKFWEVENIPTKRLKESDSYCESNFLQTTTRDASDRYVLTLPFREPENFGSKLGHSRSIALDQFLRNENRFKRDFPLKEQYDSVIQEYLDLGHMKEVPPSYDSPSYYLPHQAVVKPESTTTKLRVVFNASSPSANGTSLNDILHAGPVLQSDLTFQILKWRYFQYVFSANITKMYRQI